MKIFVAPNSFKGSLTAVQAAGAMFKGIKKALPCAEVRLLPVSDGGDGFMEVLLRRLGGKVLRARVRDPLGRPRRAHYAMLADGKTAVLEMAAASGMALLKKHELDPLNATSCGTGQLIMAAAEYGAKTALVGLGGSATNDAGAGAARAAGARFLDRNGKELPRGTKALLRLSRIDMSGLRPEIKGVSVIGVTDVINPLLGSRGSARVYGPQKGASPEEVAVMEAALARYACVIRKQLGRNIGDMPGGAAAGGLGAGLNVFFGARLVDGADFVLNMLEAEKEMRPADLILTGEGCFDSQSFFGKAPVAVSRLAGRLCKPAVVVCGQKKDIKEKLLKKNGISHVITLAEAGAGPADSMARAAYWVEKTAEMAIRRFSEQGSK
ncbi:MAG: glycerate kinase [bacterium]